MDGPQFDALTQRLTSIRLTRGEALRGVVAGALTLAGMAQVAEEASAARRRRRGQVCHCSETAGGTCSTQRAGRKQRRMHLRDHQCDYQGACRTNIDACAAAPIIVDTGRLGDGCTSNGQCGNDSGLECVGGFCVPLDLNTRCTNNGECSTGRCEEGFCVLCLEADTCETATGPQCCTGLATCDPNTHVCVLMN
jgi:hypothetical protein